MRIHKEGRKILFATFLFLSIVCFAVDFWANQLFWPVLVICTVFFLLILQFFRNPVREVIIPDNNVIYAPCDGKVCVIEEVTEGEYFKDRRLQVSIFMSPVNVHEIGRAHV